MNKKDTCYSIAAELCLNIYGPGCSKEDEKRVWPFDFTDLI